jgi:hypothetical protein
MVWNPPATNEIVICYNGGSYFTIGKQQAQLLVADDDLCVNGKHNFESVSRKQNVVRKRYMTWFFCKKRIGCLNDVGGRRSC